MKRLSRQEFACLADAQQAAEQFNQSLRYHRLDVTQTHHGVGLGHGPVFTSV